jgi:hypothetical protein
MDPRYLLINDERKHFVLNNSYVDPIEGRSSNIRATLVDSHDDDA